MTVEGHTLLIQYYQQQLEPGMAHVVAAVGVLLCSMMQ